MHNERLAGKSHESERDYNCEEPLSDNDDLEVAMDVTNTNFDNSGVSPIKFHDIEKRRKVSILKEKLQRSFRRQEMQTARAIIVDRNELD